MKRLPVVVILVSLLVSAPFRGEPRVDDLQPGMSRGRLEEHLRRTPVPVVMYRDVNFAVFVSYDDMGRAQWTFGIGNHPNSFEVGETREATDLRHPPDRTGWAYGPDEHNGLPYVGFDATGKVSWVCGRTLRAGFGSWSGEQLEAVKDAPLAGRSLFPRPGYCMGGPFAFSSRDGRLEVILAKSTDASSNVVLLSGP